MVVKTEVSVEDEATEVAETEEVIVATIKIVVSRTANSDQATIVEDLVEAVEANTIVTVVIGQPNNLTVTEKMATNIKKTKTKQTNKIKIRTAKTTKQKQKNCT